MKKQNRELKKKFRKAILLFILFFLMCLLDKWHSAMLWNAILRILLGAGILFLALNLLGGIQSWKEERDSPPNADTKGEGKCP